MERSGHHVLVIGAGIVGVNCALALRKKGFAVTVVDDKGPGEATSFGNAGCIAVAEVAPVSMPGLIWHVPRMLLDPLGPLAIRLRYLPQLAPWLWRFWRAGRRREVERIAGALASLLKRTWRDYEPVFAEAGLNALVSRSGMVYVYRSEQALRAAAYEWDLCRRNGVAFDALDAVTIRGLEPALSPDFVKGYFTPDWGHVADPYRIARGIADHAGRLGCEFRRGRVSGFEFADGVATGARLADGGNIKFDSVVVAAGAWSKPLAAQFGHKVPLDTERGYNTTLPNPGVPLSRPVTFCEDNFVATPMAMGLRIGGAVELAGLGAPPNFARAKALLALGKAALPNLNNEGGTEWMGFRPSLPDSMPVIARSPRWRNAHFAFGHGHLGLTLSATTGRLIADLVADETPPTDVLPFRIDRF